MAQLPARRSPGVDTDSCWQEADPGREAGCRSAGGLAAAELDVGAEVDMMAATSAGAGSPVEAGRMVDGMTEDVGEVVHRSHSPLEVATWKTRARPRSPGEP